MFAGTVIAIVVIAAFAYDMTRVWRRENEWRRRRITRD